MLDKSKKEIIDRKNRCRDFVYKTPLVIKNWTVNCFNRFVLTPGKYFISKANEIKGNFYDSTLSYVKSKFFTKKND